MLGISHMLQVLADRTLALVGMDSFCNGVRVIVEVSPCVFDEG